MNTPHFTTSDPKDFADVVRARLLGIADKVTDLRKSPTIRYHMLEPESEGAAIKRVTISESYANEVHADIVSRTVRIKDKLEGNAIICNRIGIV